MRTLVVAVQVIGVSIAIASERSVGTTMQTTRTHFRTRILFRISRIANSCSPSTVCSAKRTMFKPSVAAEGASDFPGPERDDGAAGSVP